MLPSGLRQKISDLLTTHSGKKTGISSATSLGGGSINEAYRLETDSGTYFLKHNKASAYPAMFEKEEKGLQVLRDAGELKVPQVIATGSSGDEAFLLLDYIESAPKQNDFWQHFGASLAKLHKHRGEYFGLDHDNYIGSLSQYNHPHPDWISFFAEERLERQARIARNSGLIGRTTLSALERLYRRLPDIFPEEAPALIHGDLWNGNFMTGEDGHACLIDPAVYYGHREMDIGMSKLFGGFDPEFYKAYNEEYPMEKGWERRADICNLYPLLVHVNLFGLGYVGEVNSILMKF
jgi:fructosamine-3-kinase